MDALLDGKKIKPSGQNKPLGTVLPQQQQDNRQ